MLYFGPFGTVLNPAEHSEYVAMKFLALALTGFLFTACVPAFAVTFKLIHQFGTGQDGDAPSWSLVQDASGNLFGTAAGGQFQGG